MDKELDCGDTVHGQTVATRCANSGCVGAWTIIIAATGSVCQTALLTLRINQGPK